MTLTVLPRCEATRRAGPKIGKRQASLRQNSRLGELSEEEEEELVPISARASPDQCPSPGPISAN